MCNSTCKRSDGLQSLNLLQLILQSFPLIFVQTTRGRIPTDASESLGLPLGMVPSLRTRRYQRFLLKSGMLLAVLSFIVLVSSAAAELPPALIWAASVLLAFSLVGTTMLEGFVAPIEIVSPFAGESLPHGASFGGIIITGSHDMVTEKHPWCEKTAHWVKQAVEAEIPVLGVCYGHQLLAQSMGGVVGDNPQGKEFGTVAIRLNQDGQRDRLFEDMPGTFAAQACHSQSVLHLPAQATLLASSDMDPHHAFAIGKRAWGVQFHPEFNGQVLRHYIQRFADDLKAQGCDVDRLLAGIRETPQSETLLRRFQQLCT